MKKQHLRVERLVYMLLGMIVGAVLGCHLLPAATPSDKIHPSAEPKFKLMAEAWNTIERFYVDRKSINSQNMTYGAISGMVDSLGDTGHSRFLTPQMLKQERSLSRGSFEGIGAEVRMKNGQLVIVAPIDGSPAQQAGLRPGDIILKVDNKEVSGLPLNQAVERILGPAGTRVSLTVLDPKTTTTRDLMLIRASITVRSITWNILPGTRVADLRIAAFSRGVTEDLQKVLLTMKNEGITGLVLDLRNNPGGLLDEAVSTASQFLSTGNVLLQKDAAGSTRAVPVRPGGTATTVPLVVLINGGTASGAEIVAGALKDADRAKLVGEKTFGTGTVLQTFSLSDSSALMIAIEEWLTPAGHVIWHQGISPDVVVPLPSDVTPLIPADQKALTEDEFRKNKDAQLLRALDLLPR